VAAVTERGAAILASVLGVAWPTAHRVGPLARQWPWTIAVPCVVAGVVGPQVLKVLLRTPARVGFEPAAALLAASAWAQGPPREGDRG
jgi:hypothetical protein